MINKLMKEVGFSLSKEEKTKIKKETEEFVSLLKKEIKKKGIDAEVFVGGSFAKNTLGRSEEGYDVDLFIRFSWKYEDLAKDLSPVMKNIGKKFEIEKLHGSRDYFRVKKDKLIFEVIPITKIGKPREMRNVTDISPFHVNYVKKEINEKLARDIIALKSFCKASRVYGAESYIQGFSGYAIECLVIAIGGFEKTLKKLIKIKKEEKLILDPKKFYKNKKDVLFEINEARLHSPIILVDPTWKERNVLAALSFESLEKLQKKAKKFLKNPSKKYFEIKEIDLDKLQRKAKKNKNEFLNISLETDRQAGDIAGTKLRKFSRFLVKDLETYFEIKEREFDYFGGKKGALYLIVKPKKEIVRQGPPIGMKNQAALFKRKNKGKKVSVKKGFLFVKERPRKTGKDFLRDWSKNNRKVMKEMSVTKLSI